VAGLNLATTHPAGEGFLEENRAALVDELHGRLIK